MEMLMNSVGNMMLFQQVLDAASVDFEKKLDNELGLLLAKSEMTLAVVEGITGGDLSRRLASLGKGWDGFLGSMICPSTRSLVNLANIDAAFLQEKGIIHQDVAIKLSRDMQKKLHADSVIAIIGRSINDPMDYQAKRAVIFMATCFNGDEKIKIFQVEGNDMKIKENATQTALMALKQWLIINKEVTNERK